MITTHVTINLTSQVSPQLIQAVQGDTGRSICFKLADFTIPAGAAATYYIQKPSGEAIYNSATISGNEITCELTAQSLAELGENPMQVRISADGEIVTSFDAILLVRPFRGIGAIESGTEMNIFDQAVEQATEQFQENAEQIVEEVIESIPADYTELTEEVDELNERIGNLSNLETEDKTNIVSAINEAARSGITDEVKVALLACFEKVAWINGHGQDYYDALENALYPSDYPKIVATLNNGINVFYTDDSLSAIKDHITVKYYDEEGSSGVVVPSASYELTGTLTEGPSVLTVTYNELSTTIVVSVYSDAVPTGYTTYDYISTSWNGADNPFSRSSDALIGFGPYENVNHVSIRTDIFPTHNILSNHVCVFGVKSNASSGAYGAGVSLYGRGSDNAYLVYTHTNSETTFTNAFTKDAINHVEIIVNDESPSTFVAGDVEHEISWERDDSLSGPIYLFTNQYPNFAGTVWLTRYFQLGKTVIVDADGTVDVYVPVLRTADNVVGLYNTTKGAFVTCADTKYATVGNSDCAYKVGNWN